MIMVMNHYILMADIIHSSHKDGDALMKDFMKISNDINISFKEAFLSPITITLGDEFQSVIKSLKDGVDVIINFEELIIKSEKFFKLRYVINYGEIETTINPEKAYGMLGKGLTDSRKMLEFEKFKKKRFYIKVSSPNFSYNVNQAFLLYQFVIDNWKFKDYKIIGAFLEHKDYKKVARILGRDPSSVWRREKSLKMEAYWATKDLIKSLTR